MYRRFLKVGILGAATIGTAVTLHRKDYEIDAVGIVRMSRAAYTAFDIAYCYKTKLYNKKYDGNSQEYREAISRVHQMSAEKLLDLCKVNKGVYIKVGQHIGALDYLLPPEYVNTMRILHKDAPLNSLDQVYNVIRQDLKEDPEELFTEFDPKPLGTASLAQVHKAKLKDGTDVAVKVQHHFVRGNVKADIRSMEYLVKIMEMIFPDFTIQWLVNETKINIYRELNFIEEGQNSEKVAKMFKHYTWLKIPKVFWEYTTERVLVMEYVTGGQVNDFDYVKANNINPYDLCKKLGDLYSHMIFEKGFVHSDPHSGNILIKKEPNDKDVTVYLLDHGLYAYLTDDFRYHYSQFWLSVMDRDQVKMKYHAGHLGMKDNMYIALACIVTGRPWHVILKGMNSIRPDDEEREAVRENLPNVIDHIALCLQNIDRQALLILKTNDLIRSIEFALKTSEMMSGLMVMTKCCLLTGYEGRHKRAKTAIERYWINLDKIWTMIKFYIAFAILRMRWTFS